MRTLLIPQRQLSGKLRILIDSRLDLQWSIDQLCFGKVVDHGRTVLCAVAATGNPANQIIPVSRRKGQNLDELLAGFPGSFISTKFGCIACVTC